LRSAFDKTLPAATTKIASLSWVAQRSSPRAVIQTNNCPLAGIGQASPVSRTTDIRPTDN